MFRLGHTGADATKPKTSRAEDHDMQDQPLAHILSGVPAGHSDISEPEDR